MNLTNITPSMAALDSLLTDALRMALRVRTRFLVISGSPLSAKSFAICRGARNDEWMGCG
jgi:hypothetical protein